MPVKSRLQSREVYAYVRPRSLVRCCLGFSVLYCTRLLYARAQLRLKLYDSRPDADSRRTSHMALLVVGTYGVRVGSDQIEPTATQRGAQTILGFTSLRDRRGRAERSPTRDADGGGSDGPSARPRLGGGSTVSLSHDSSTSLHRRVYM